MKKNIKYYAIVTIFSTIFFYANATEEVKENKSETRLAIYEGTEATKPETRIATLGEIEATKRTNAKKINILSKNLAKALSPQLLTQKKLNVLSKDEQHAFQRYLHWIRKLVEYYVRAKTELIQATASTSDQQQPNVLLMKQQTEAEAQIKTLTEALKKTEEELQTTKSALEKALDANQKQKKGHGEEKRRLLKQKNDNEAELGKTNSSLESIRAELEAAKLRNEELDREVTELNTAKQTLETQNRQLRSLSYDKTRLQGQINILAENSAAAMGVLAKAQKSFRNNIHMKKLSENMDKIDAAVTQLKNIIAETQDSATNKTNQ